MRWLSYLLNVVYLLLLVVLSPWLVVAAIRKGKYRAGHAAKLLGWVPRRRGARPCVWLHAVSVGEVNLLRPLIAALARRRPELECVVSTTTMTGYALAKTRYPQQLVFYCPLDFSWAVASALRRIRPTLLVLAELELWPNLIRSARRQGVRSAVVNARMGARSYRGYRRIRPLMAHLLRQIDLIAAQDETIAQRFLALGAVPHSVSVTGSLKYDGAETDRDNAATRALRSLAGFQPEDRVFLAGSTQAPEEALCVAVYRELAVDYPALRLILVPRHPDRFDEAAAMLSATGMPFQRRSRLGHQYDLGPGPRILLVDAVGELGAWWGTASIAFVGGSLTGRGGQNMIEPAAYGAAVSFGPNTWNFRDIAASLCAAQAAVVVRNQDELTRFVRRC
ncbi:MAG: hypothetical protein A2W31_01155, partial [Planctomycetes bacterium RBG_16_64_10]